MSGFQVLLPAVDDEEDEEWIYEDMELINDLGTGSNWTYGMASDPTVTDVYHQMVITNRLLGIIIALLFVFMIFGLIRFIMRLVSDNITNYF